MAGSRTPEAMTPREIARLIRAAGREPLERDTLYNVIRDSGFETRDSGFGNRESGDSAGRESHVHVRTVN